MGSTSGSASQPRTGTSRLRIVGALIVAASALGVATAWAAGSPPEGPTLETMALSTSDFARGAVVYQQGFQSVQTPFVAKYVRYFAPGARLGGQRLLSVASIVDLLDDPGTTSLAFNAVRDAFNSPAGRQAVAKQFIQEIRASTKGRLKVRSVAFGRVVTLTAGQGSFRVLMKLRTNVGPVEIGIVGIVVDRAIGVLALDGFPHRHVPAATAVLGAQKLAQHFQVAFMIRNITPPTVVGTPARGSTLTADRGRWAGGPSSFTYQWNHCDVAGANCAAIAGAVSQTYVPGTADAGARLTVTVTATNSVSSAPVSSAATAPVT
jgi:hypothetical protein